MSFPHPLPRRLSRLDNQHFHVHAGIPDLFYDYAIGENLNSNVNDYDEAKDDITNHIDEMKYLRKLIEENYQKMKQLASQKADDEKILPQKRSWSQINEPSDHILDENHPTRRAIKKVADKIKRLNFDHDEVQKSYKELMIAYNSANRQQINDLFSL